MPYEPVHTQGLHEPMHNQGCLKRDLLRVRREW